MNLISIANKYKSNIKPQEVKLLRENIQIIKEYIEEQKRQNDGMSVENLKEKMENEFVDKCNKYYDVIRELSGIDMQERVIKNINEDRQLISNVCKEISDKELEYHEDVKFFGDKDEITKKYIENHLYKFREYEEELRIRVSKEKEEEALRAIFKNGLEELNQIKKQDNIKMIETMADFFECYQIFEKTVKNHNTVLERLWLEELGYDENTRL